VTPVLQHLTMGIGFGGLGFLLVLGVRGTDDAPRREEAALALGDAALPADAEAPGDAGSASDASVDGPRDGALSPSVAALASLASLASPSSPPPAPTIFRVAHMASDPTVTLADGTLGKRPFLTALAAAGVGLKESYRVLHAIGHVRNMNHTSPTDVFHVAKDKGSGRVVAFEYVTSPIDVFQARDEGGVLEAKKLDLHVDTKTVAVPLVVSEELKAVVKKAGLEEEILQRIDDALDGHAELSDIQKGARLRLLATAQSLDGTFLRYASVDALEYTPATRDATPLRVYHFPRFDREKAWSVGVSREGTFYDTKGQQPFHGGWRIPVPGARIASRFNLHRMHPTLHVVMPHNGVDFAAPPGTPIYAAASGTVKSVGDSGPCGNMVQVEHGTATASLISSYCHMSRFAAGIHPGEHVETRQLLGYVGQTGRATGPHLHFAIKKNGIFIDPLAMKLDGVRVVPPGKREEFEAMRAELDKALDAIPLEPLSPDAGLPPAPAPGDAGAPDAPPEEIFDDTPMQ
jgi:murein DD-endopeptidase MepM/ murein hydrolase activator NlpD